MPDPNLPTPEPPTPEPPPASRARLVCEFCSCQLTPAGDVLRMSDEARALARQGETIATLRADLKTVNETLAGAQAATDAAQRELAALQAPKPRQGFLSKEIEP